MDQLKITAANEMIFDPQSSFAAQRCIPYLQMSHPKPAPFVAACSSFKPIETCTQHPLHFNQIDGFLGSVEEPNYRYFCLNMKLVDALVLSLAVAFLIIGIHQTMVLGFGKAYWAIMLSLGLYFVFNFRKKQ